MVFLKWHCFIQTRFCHLMSALGWGTSGPAGAELLFKSVLGGVGGGNGASNSKADGPHDPCPWLSKHAISPLYQELCRFCSTDAVNPSSQEKWSVTLLIKRQFAAEQRQQDKLPLKETLFGGLSSIIEKQFCSTDIGHFMSCSTLGTNGSRDYILLHAMPWLKFLFLIAEKEELVPLPVNMQSF